MKIKIATMTLLTFVACQSGFSDFKRGQILQDIICKEDTQYSYLLYLPESFNPDRETRWPVMFFMGANGGYPQMVKRFMESAEQNEWIFALSTQCGEGFKNSEDAVLAMVNDVFASFPVKEDQCYAGGIGFGAGMAYWLADEYEEHIVGLLTLNRFIPDDAVNVPNYIFCRASCGARNKVVYLSDNLKENYVVDFFASEKNIPPEEKLNFSMKWMQAQYLNKKGSNEEREHFSAQLLSDTKTTLTDDPYLAFQYAELLSKLKKMPDYKAAKDLLKELEEFPEIERYLKARKAMDDFIDDYINLRPQEYDDQYRTSNEPTEEARKLAEEFSDTPLGHVIRDLGIKTPAQSKTGKK